MSSKLIQKKGIISRLLEKCLNILVRNECKKIGKIKIDIIASSIQIIKGEIPKIYIIADDINYKYLLFDKIELEANDIKIKFKINKNELTFKNDFIINIKILLSQNSLRTILFSSNWDWIRKMITKEILNEETLEGIQIKNDKLLIITAKKGKTLKEVEKIDIKAENGKLYLKNQSYNKYIRIPIEDKVCIKDVKIKNNIINIFANSSVDF
tara:strand:- start:517 stop:1149 length:633 start_codon:yes stop_codon:yes gene_type:complete